MTSALIRRCLRPLLIPLLLAATAVGLVAVTSASAATDYGPWFSEPGTGSNAYQADAEPFNSEGVSEVTQFACVLDNGETISEDQEFLLGSIFRDAASVYNGEYQLKIEDDPEDFGGDIHAKVSSNSGFATGETGMRAFLQTERQVLLHRGWVPKDNRELVPAGDQKGSEWASWYPLNGAEVDIDEGVKQDEGYEDMQANPNEFIKLINFEARNPLQLTNEIPEACNLGGLLPDEPGGFSDFLGDPGKYMLELMFYLPRKGAGEIYNLSYPWAVQFSFFTPHTERGDTMWNVSFTCSKKAAADQRDELLVDSGAFNGADIAAQCAGGKPLGYDKRNFDYDRATKKSPWIQVGQFLQWIISGTYFILIAVAAILFMFRGNSGTNLNLMRLLPRLLVSIVLTIFSSFLIGAVISTGNMLTGAVFGFTNEFKVLGFINSAVLQAGSVGGGGEEFTRLVIETMVVVPMALFVTGLALLALARQIALIILIAIAPLAAFCLLVDGWRHHFVRYLRAILVIAFIPVMLALIMWLTTSINPLVASPSSSYGTLLGALGLFMIVATFWVMFRVAKVGLGAITSSSAVAGTGFMGLGAGQMAGKLSNSRGGMLGGLGNMAAGALGAYAGASAAGDRMSGKLVPQDKVMGALAPGMSGAAATAAGLSGGGAVDRAVAKRQDNRSTKERMNQFMDRRQGDASEAVAGGAAGALAGAGAVGATRQLKGPEMQSILASARADASNQGLQWDQMSKVQRDSFVNKAAGGEVVEQGGQMFVKEAAPIPGAAVNAPATGASPNAGAPAAAPAVAPAAAAASGSGGISTGEFIAGAAAGGAAAGAAGAGVRAVANRSSRPAPQASAPAAGAPLAPAAGVAGAAAGAVTPVPNAPEPPSSSLPDRAAAAEQLAREQQQAATQRSHELQQQAVDTAKQSVEATRELGAEQQRSTGKLIDEVRSSARPGPDVDQSLAQDAAKRPPRPEPPKAPPPSPRR